MRKALRNLLVILLAAVVLTAFFLAIIMGQPQGNAPAAVEQPLLPPLTETVAIDAPDELAQLLNAFPAPVMAAMHVGSLTFVQGAAADVPFETGAARCVTLTYVTAEGGPVTVQSIYPARALDVMGKGDFVLTGTAGHPLAGLRSVRMEQPGWVRMHAQSDEALYVITMPEGLSASLRNITAAMQLYQGESTAP